METAAQCTQSELKTLLTHLTTAAGARRPVMLWGSPGGGKSALVTQFAQEMGLDCLSLLGSQLAPEDLIGVPRIEGDYSVFCPPKQIAREEPYVLFLDELNACSQDVQKAFYSLINDRRLGQYELHPESIVIGAGNRTEDSAIVKPMSSALINRMLHIQLIVNFKDWYKWAEQEGIHPLILRYLQTRPEHLHSKPPKTERTFSTPRSWHLLSDALGAYEAEDLDAQLIYTLASTCLTPEHATRFKSFYMGLDSQYDLEKIVKGQAHWPTDPDQMDLLYDLALAFRSKLIKELPPEKDKAHASSQELRHHAKPLLVSLAEINPEFAKLVVTEPAEGASLPNWFLVEVMRDLPRLIESEQ